MNDLGKMVIERALAGVESLPPEVRADVYHGLAEILRPHSAKEADAAMQLATALREAGHRQLQFDLIMSGEQLTASKAPSDLGERLFQARRKAGLTSHKVAASAGISPGYYSEIEHGKKTPSARVLKQLAKVLPEAFAGLLKNPPSTQAGDGQGNGDGESQ